MLLRTRMLVFVCSMPWTRKDKLWTQCRLVLRSLNSTNPLFFHLDKQSTAKRTQWSDHVDMHTCNYIWPPLNTPTLFICTTFGAYVRTLSIGDVFCFLSFFFYSFSFGVVFCVLHSEAAWILAFSTLYRWMYIDRVTYIKIQSNLTVHENHVRIK